eukprot:FR737433.1.p1 GENE.FR737433.1~~FR737433.1.p1  ORF type:complete len:141 (+),score=15.24 FR737433.1:84-506(+)
MAHGHTSISAEDLLKELHPRKTFAGETLDMELAREMIQEVTHNEGATTISKKDFPALKKKLGERKGLVEAFNVYDRDGDHQVSLGDLYQTMLSNGETVTLDEVKDMLNECDLHHNGYLNFEDFRKAMASGDGIEEEEEEK